MARFFPGVRHSDGSLHRIRHMVEVTAGLRHGELNGLTWDCIDLGARTIAVRRSQTELKGERLLEKPKTKAGFRVIQIGPKLTEELKRWRLRCPLSDKKLVLPAETGKSSCRSTNNRILKATAERAGTGRCQ